MKTKREERERREGRTALRLKHVEGHRCSVEGGPDPACLVPGSFNEDTPIPAWPKGEPAPRLDSGPLVVGRAEPANPGYPLPKDLGRPLDLRMPNIFQDPALPSAYQGGPEPDPSAPAVPEDLPLDPLRDLLILRHLPARQSFGRFVIPQEHQERPTIAVILAAGKGRYTETGAWVPVDPKLQPGVHVLVPKFAGQEFEVGDEKYVVVRSDEAMGIVKPQETAPALEVG